MQSNPDLLILNATIRRRYQKHRDEYNKTMPAPNGNSGGHGFLIGIDDELLVTWCAGVENCVSELTRHASILLL